MNQAQNDNKIPVYLDESEAKHFLVFEEHYDFFTLLIDRNVHLQRGAEVSLSFDSKGHLAKISRKDLLYSSKYAFDNFN